MASTVTPRHPEVDDCPNKAVLVVPSTTALRWMEDLGPRDSVGTSKAIDRAFAVAEHPGPAGPAGTGPQLKIFTRKLPSGTFRGRRTKFSTESGAARISLHNRALTGDPSGGASRSATLDADHHGAAPIIWPGRPQARPGTPVANTEDVFTGAP